MSTGNVNVRTYSIQHLWNEGIRDPNEIHRRTNISKRTIYYNLAKLKKTGSVAHKQRSGRPKKITPATSKAIGQYIRRNSAITTKMLVTKLLERDIQVSEMTVWRHVTTMGYKKSLPLATPMLTSAHKEKRVKWARNHLWGIIKTNVERRMPKNLAELERFMIEEWHNISQDIVNNLIRSMKERCILIIQNNGERIAY
jgi:transposase